MLFGLIGGCDDVVERVRAIGVREMTSSSTKTFRPKHHHTRSGNNTTQTAVLISYMLIFFFSFS